MKIGDLIETEMGTGYLLRERGKKNEFLIELEQPRRGWPRDTSVPTAYIPVSNDTYYFVATVLVDGKYIRIRKALEGILQDTYSIY